MTDPRDDSEIDYLDDELPEDQLPVDQEAARELGADLDDPEAMDADDADLAEVVDDEDELD
jgi:hypothetical protein